MIGVRSYSISMREIFFGDFQLLYTSFALIQGPTTSELECTMRSHTRTLKILRPSRNSHHEAQTGGGFAFFVAVGLLHVLKLNNSAISCFGASRSPDCDSGQHWGWKVLSSQRPSWMWPNFFGPVRIHSLWWVRLLHQEYFTCSRPLDWKWTGIHGK